MDGTHLSRWWLNGTAWNIVGAVLPNRVVICHPAAELFGIIPFLLRSIDLLCFSGFEIDQVPSSSVNFHAPHVKRRLNRRPPAAYKPLATFDLVSPLPLHSPSPLHSHSLLPSYLPIPSSVLYHAFISVVWLSPPCSYDLQDYCLCTFPVSTSVIDSVPPEVSS